jgi:hypothetical protein
MLDNIATSRWMASLISYYNHDLINTVFFDQNAHICSQYYDYYHKSRQKKYYLAIRKYFKDLSLIVFWPDHPYA